jgi:hypothetical protein
MKLSARALSLFLLALTGCAGTTVHQVKFACEPPPAGTPSKLDVSCTKPLATPSDGMADADVDGIRYYEPSPYLLVYSDGKGGLVSKLLYLPDLTKKRVIKPYAYLAANISTLTFSNGMLTQSKVVADETVVPKAVVGVLEQTALAALGTSLNVAGTPTTPRHPPPYLFKVELSNGQARLVGGAGMDANGNPRFIDVTVTKTGSDAKPADGAASGAK